LGSELGAKVGQTPDNHGFILRTALAFPEVYEIAHSHLGHKILYHLFNEEPGFAAERVYAPWPDYEAYLLNSNQPLKSLETQTPLKDFHVVGFSLQYELSYTNILNMLSLGRIHPLKSQRDRSAPLVLAGGPGAVNPEPLADFFDIFFVGEAEDAWLGDYTIIKDWAREKAPIEELFDRLAGRPGVYIPSLFQPRYSGLTFLGLDPLKTGYTQVAKAQVASLQGAPFPACQIAPWVKPVHDRVVVEIARGCVRGCRFCQAGYIYRPVRERSASEALDLAERNLKATGYGEVAFLSLSAGDHTQIEPLVRSFMDRHAAEEVALSLPSLRVKSLSPSLAKEIARVRKTGFTIAPEAATDRLRAIINKDLSEEDLFGACETAFSLGWRTIKLYFMSGLPGETTADLEAMVTLATRLKKLGRAKINLSVATFIPKAHTPFQWALASDIAAINERHALLAALARKPGLDLSRGLPAASLLEAILARGDRSLGQVLYRVWEKGARFEAWNERLRPELWFKALDELGFDLPTLLAARDLKDPLPWDHIGPLVSREFLLKELDKAHLGLTTPDCRTAGCQGCGACAVNPMSLAAPPTPVTPPTPPPAAKAGEEESLGAKAEVLSPLTSEVSLNSPEKGKNTAQRSDKWSKASSQPTAPPGVRVLLEFEKTGPLALLGHLEMVEVFKRAFRRAEIKVAFSQGFHPQMKLSFLTALPLGQESFGEILAVTLTKPLLPEEIIRRLTLPPGLRITKARILALNEAKLKVDSISYLIESETDLFIKQPLHPKVLLRYTDSKGRPREFDLAVFVSDLSTPNPRSLHLTLKQGPTGGPQPLAATRALFDLPEDLVLSVKKLATNLAP
jgi:radical SAM family uncharacterized protein/radical SAM-linked protein